MIRIRKCLASVAALSMMAAITLPAAAAAPSRQTKAFTPQSFSRIQIAGIPHSMIPSRDFGRRRPLDLVTATVMLRYNREAELNALVDAQSNPRSPLYHHFLTSAQFNNYFAPTPQQQSLVIARLRAAGLRVRHTFANRTILDVQGTSASAEEYFATEIHSVSQDKYGARFANVKPITVPADIAPLIRSVSLSNLIVARSRPLVSARANTLGGFGARRPPVIGRFRVPTYVAPRHVNSANVVVDSGFESGAFGHGWNQCEVPNSYPLATITSNLSHTGKYSGRAGSVTPSSGQQFGFAGVCQLVTIPTGGILSAYLYQLTNQSNRLLGGEDVALLDTNGYVAAILAVSANNHAGWAVQSWNVAPYAGRKLYLYFGVHGDGYKTDFTQQYVDDVTLIGSGATPTPTPKPTATPTAKPTANPTATPTVKPTAPPTVKPTATPTATPTTSPIACTGTKESGPFRNSNGWLATGIAVAFDFPVQHGCDGATRTAAIVIDNSVDKTDLNAYLTAAKVTETGTFTNVPVDGGGQVDNNSEATLDVETVVGLAPGANVIDYNIGELSNQHVEDAYNKAVSDNLADAVNSSFGGCESDDPTGDMAEDAIAVQGAAKGITFVGTSGDTGSDECNTGNNPPGVSGTNGPHFLSVGSMQFTADATTGALLKVENSEIGEYGFSGFPSGGGVSSVYALPSYQSGITNVITTGRNQPDISLPGDDVAVYGGGAFGGVSETVQDGTSWSGPQITALLTETVEVHNGTRLGFVNPAIYALFKATGYADFYDIVGGNNGTYSAVTGYDQVTGIGAPKGYAFALAL